MISEAKLILYQGTPEEKIVDLDRTEVTLGRDPSCQVVFSEATISRRHAQLRREGDSWTISDLGSSNGTFVNGRRITGSQAVRSGDVIGLGSTQLLFQGGEPLVVPSRARDATALEWTPQTQGTLPTPTVPPPAVPEPTPVPVGPPPLARQPSPLPDVGPRPLLPATGPAQDIGPRPPLTEPGRQVPTAPEPEKRPRGCLIGAVMGGIILILLICVLAVGGYFFLSRPQPGSTPKSWTPLSLSQGLPTMEAAAASLEFVRN
ncbi:MAG: FHA domain-containing protein [Chloroflexota bacterium]